MAKKSLIAKSKRTPKFAVREYTRCKRTDHPYDSVVFLGTTFSNSGYLLL